MKVPDHLGCGEALAEGQWWTYCGETDMGQTAPARCTECGGDYKRESDMTIGNPRAEAVGKRVAGDITDVRVTKGAVTGKDPGKGHFYVSIVKSVLRLFASAGLFAVGYNFGITALAGAGVLFFAAEILGIVEELVD